MLSPDSSCERSLTGTLESVEVNTDPFTNYNQDTSQCPTSEVGIVSQNVGHGCISSLEVINVLDTVASFHLRPCEVVLERLSETEIRKYMKCSTDVEQTTMNGLEKHSLLENLGSFIRYKGSSTRGNFLDAKKLSSSPLSLKFSDDSSDEEYLPDELDKAKLEKEDADWNPHWKIRRTRSYKRKRKPKSIPANKSGQSERTDDDSTEVSDSFMNNLLRRRKLASSVVSSFRFDSFHEFDFNLKASHKVEENITLDGKVSQKKESPLNKLTEMNEVLHDKNQQIVYQKHGSQLMPEVDINKSVSSSKFLQFKQSLCSQSMTHAASSNPTILRVQSLKQTVNCKPNTQQSLINQKNRIPSLKVQEPNLNCKPKKRSSAVIHKVNGVQEPISPINRTPTPQHSVMNHKINDQVEYERESWTVGPFLKRNEQKDKILHSSTETPEILVLEEYIFHCNNSTPEQNSDNSLNKNRGNPYSKSSGCSYSEMSDELDAIATLAAADLEENPKAYLENQIESAKTVLDKLKSSHLQDGVNVKLKVIENEKRCLQRAVDILLIFGSFVNMSKVFLLPV